MALDAIIRRALLPTLGAGGPQSIGIAGGKIVTIAPEIAGGAAVEFDAGGRTVLPGLIDPHVHFNEPGRTEWEGIASGSAALAGGGGTCFFDMPLNSSPPVLNGAAFDAKLAAASRSSYVDFGIWGGLVPGNLGRLEELAGRGVVGLKAFMCHSGIDEFPCADDDSLHEGMVRAASLGLPVAVHAESQGITSDLTRDAMAAGRVGVRDFLASRPVLAELDAIDRAIRLARQTRCSLHIVHVSTGAGVALVVAARSAGVDVTCETCPHYLFLTDADVERIGPVAKCAPPVRSRRDQDELWSKLLGGHVMFVASDHSPAPMSMKASANFFEVWGGIAGCQTTLPLLLTEGVSHGLTLADVARLTSQGAARRFGLAGKGVIAVGADADLVVINSGAGEALAAEHLLYRHRISPFVGRRVHGMVHATFVRGRCVFLNGRIVLPSAGRFIGAHPGCTRSRQ